MIPMALSLLVLIAADEIAFDDVGPRNVEPIPPKYASAIEVGIYLESKQLELKRKGFHSLTFRLINPTNAAITFAGYSEREPLYTIQTWGGSEWEKTPLEWICGTGVRKCVIRSGESAVIVVPVETQWVRFPVRVGVDYKIENHAEREWQTVWSQKIEQDSQIAGPHKMERGSQYVDDETFKKRYPPKSPRSSLR